MIGPLPSRPKGTSQEATFMAWVWDQITGPLKISQSPGNNVQRTTRGTAIISKESKNRLDFEAGLYVIKSVQGDYVTAKRFDGSGETGDNVFLAKEYKIRNSLITETIHGDTHNYAFREGPDSNNVIRTHVSGSFVQDEIIVPPWTSGEIVMAVSSKTGIDDASGNSINLQMIRSSQWARY